MFRVALAAVCCCVVQLAAPTALASDSTDRLAAVSSEYLRDFIEADYDGMRRKPAIRDTAEEAVRVEFVNSMKSMRGLVYPKLGRIEEIESARVRRRGE